MVATNARRILFLAVLAVLFLGVRAWLHDAPVPSPSPGIPAPAPAAAAAPETAGTADRTVPRASAVDAGSSRADVHEAARSPTATIPMLQRKAMRLDVRAPIDVRVGEMFEARVTIDAGAPVRDLVFAIAYEKSRLSLIRRSEGEFVRQPGIRAEYGIDEPSDGYVGVVFKAVDGSFASAGGDVVVLEFEALRPGTSRIELQNVKAVDASGDTNRKVVVTPASVTVH